MTSRTRHLLAATALLAAAVLPLSACTPAQQAPEPPPSGAASSGTTPAPGSAATSPGSGSQGTTPGPGSAEAPGGSSAAGSSAAPGTEGPATAAARKAAAQLAGLDLEQRVGQVLMIGIPANGADAQTRDALASGHVGNVFLKGRSSAGVAATAADVQQVRNVLAEGQGGIAPFVSTDQEGGLVQVLKGPGFSTIPSALVQGSWEPATLRERAAAWGRELRSAGITVNLAPVADTVPASIGEANAPIGHFGREYGHTPAAAASGSTAFSRGMLAAGVAPVIKHFPGLGQVTRNTDVSSGVTDRSTTRDDPTLKPFRAGIQAGNDWVMLSSAYYAKIDPENPAAFSPTIIGGMLRGDLGFDGIVVSDDLCEARQVAQWTYAERAQRFFDAGGTMFLCVDAAATPAIHDALVARASKDAGFRATIDAAALKVLEVKARS